MKMPYRVGLFVLVIGCIITLVDTQQPLSIFIGFIIWLPLALAAGALWQILFTGGWSLRARVRLPAFRALAIAVAGGVGIAAIVLIGAHGPWGNGVRLGFWFVVIGTPFFAARQVKGSWWAIAVATAAIALLAVVMAATWAYIDRNEDQGEMGNIGVALILIFGLFFAPIAGAAIGLISQLGKRPASPASAS